MKEREKFKSRLGFILVSAGCAVGLGNVWKFPYICGQNGGAAFILIYLFFLITLGFPILISEFSIGRGSGKSMAHAYDNLEQKGTKWHFFKWFSFIGLILLMMFYTMVGGWMLYYVYRSCTGELIGDADHVAECFTSMLADGKTMTLWAFIAIIVSFAVCAFGIQKGIEKVTKVMMIALLGLIIILAIHSLTLDNAMEGVKFYLIPNLDAIRDRGLGTVVFDAMSHAFFTLSIGIGSMEIFGSYLDKEHSLVGEAGNVVVLDTFVALMAGFIIIPACFAFGVAPGAGPSLLFITLPNIFNNMAGGRVWGILFFVFMSFAALSTIIAVFEGIVAFLMEILNWSRVKTVLICIVGISVLSLPAILGFNVLSMVQPMGEGSTIMDLEDFFVSYNLLPLGSLIMVLFCSRKNGWGWGNFVEEVNKGRGRRMSNKLRFYYAYVLPIVILVIYFKGYYDMFAPMGTASLLAWMLIAVALVSFILIFSLIGQGKAEG